MNESFCSDTIIRLGIKQSISDFVISGQTRFNNENDAFVRVVVIDNYNYEYLIYENYPLLAGDSVIDFQNISIETKYLDGVMPVAIRIEVFNATLHLSSFGYKKSSNSSRMRTTGNIYMEQSQKIVNALNQNLEKRNMTWRAGQTSLSYLSYEEKKSLFGGKVPMLYGLEYYAGGIFVAPKQKTNSVKISTAQTTNYVTKWDWRERHGKNWISPVKYHVNCGACWAFAAVSVVEAYANLYYNRIINFDLSEEEIVSCSRINGCRGGFASDALSYMRNHGVVNENCFPFIDMEADCAEKCDNPEERLFIENYQLIQQGLNEDSLKRHLFKSPMTITLREWTHAMALVGYHVIKTGDVIYFGNSFPVSYTVIDSIQHQDLIGKTAWIMKNSWALWGENGYLSAVFDINYSVSRIYQPMGRITCSTYNDSDILCEDADGDGYYNWGVGPKPANCPPSIPDTPDGDDSDPTVGPIDEYGNLSILTNELVISSIVEYGSVMDITHNIRIVNGGHLRITNMANLHNAAQITVESGGTLTIDGGTLNEARIIFNPGSALNIYNGGTIVKAADQSLLVPTGTNVMISSGKMM